MLCYFKFVFLVVFFCDVVKTNEEADNNNTLYFVHVLFRHGERTPQGGYPKDIYKEEQYYPYRYGELVNEGKQRMYNLGLLLSKRYKNFLNNACSESEIVARSSPLLRTRMSCELAMAALSNPEIPWNPDLSLPPTKCKHKPIKNNLMFLADRNCPEIKRLRDEEMTKDALNGKFDQYKDLFDYLTNHSGWKIEYPANITKLYDILRCQHEMGLELPAWADDVFPVPLTNLTLADWDYVGIKNEDLKRYNAGVLLKNIVDNTKKKICENEEYEEKKLSAYCCHDTNIIAMLGILGIYERHVMPYAATLIFEIHRVKENYQVKVFYQNQKTWNPKLMVLPKCRRECTLEDFERGYQSYYGSKDMC